MGVCMHVFECVCELSMSVFLNLFVFEGAESVAKGELVKGETCHI